MSCADLIQTNEKHRSGLPVFKCNWCGQTQAAQSKLHVGMKCRNPKHYLLPNVIILAAHWSEAMYKWVLNGCRYTNTEQHAKRNANCNGCELHHFDSQGKRRCGHGGCGCYLERKMQLIIETDKSDCPKGIWEIIQ